MHKQTHHTVCSSVHGLHLGIIYMHVLTTCEYHCLLKYTHMHAHKFTRGLNVSVPLLLMEL